MTASEERTYRRIKDGALTELCKEMQEGFAEVNGRIDSMGKDLAKVMERTGGDSAHQPAPPGP